MAERFEMSWAQTAHERAILYTTRLEDSVIRRGRDLLVIWDSSNSADNPLRQLPGPDGKAVAINLAMSACLHEAIMVVSAVLDRPKSNRPLKNSNLVSFPVIAALLMVEGTQELRWADGDRDIKIAAENRLFRRLDQLESGVMQPRLARVRAFRDTFLAHALDEEFTNPPPVLSDIHSLMDEATAISADCQLALFGRRVAIRQGLVTVEESISAVWRMLAR